MRVSTARRGDGWRRVEQVLDAWRIDEEWWRPEPIHRLYYRVLLDHGGVIDMYYDVVGGVWYEQRYHGAG